MPIADLVSDLFSSRCSACHEPGAYLCRRCRFALAAAPGPRGATAGVAAALPYDGVVRTTILSLKYRNRRAVARTLARLVVRRLHLGDDAPYDLVTWAPTSSRRVRARGYDQAELLAREVARELGVPCRRLLHRAHGAPTQTGRSSVERRSAPGGFRAPVVRRPLRVLLVDDVVTTGTTLARARACLAEAGVTEVRAVAVAATPVPTLATVRPLRRPTPALALAS